MIGEDGSVSSSAGQKGRLRIVEFADPQSTTREGSNLWVGTNPIEATETRVLQGSIEKSNVNGVGEMTEMIRVQRAYESVASLISKQDDQRRTAIQKLGNLNG
jgi:flagellar basal-body rod protein FlgF